MLKLVALRELTLSFDVVNVIYEQFTEFDPVNLTGSNKLPVTTLLGIYNAVIRFSVQLFVVFISVGEYKLIP